MNPQTLGGRLIFPNISPCSSIFWAVLELLVDKEQGDAAIPPTSWRRRNEGSGQEIVFSPPVEIRRPSRLRDFPAHSFVREIRKDEDWLRRRVNTRKRVLQGKVTKEKKHLPAPTLKQKQQQFLRLCCSESIATPRDAERRGK